MMADDIVDELRGLAKCDARAGAPLGECMVRAAAEIERLRAENDASRDLLAVIHGDGGHYTHDVGFKKSCDDAETKVVQERTVADELAASEAQATADRAEVLRAADRLHVAASEALYCIASKGWNADGEIKWSVAGCQRHLYDELDAATVDMRDVLEAKHQSELEKRGRYADVVKECAQAVTDADFACAALRALHDLIDLDREVKAYNTARTAVSIVRESGALSRAAARRAQKEDAK